MIERTLPIEGVLLEVRRCTLVETILPAYFPKFQVRYYSKYKMLSSAKTVELLSIKGKIDPSFDRNRTMADT